MADKPRDKELRIVSYVLEHCQEHPYMKFEADWTIRSYEEDGERFDKKMMKSIDIS